MTDINPDTPPKPIEVPNSPVPSQVATGSRDFLLIVAALPALVAVFGTRDVKQIIDWFGSEPGLAFIGAVVVLATPLWRQWKARRAVADLQAMEPHTPSSVAVRQGAAT